MKYVFVSGGVISGLGKGIITSSVALLLKDKGYRVAPVKVDMYLNVDAGTLRPQEHGETFVLASGLETDQDMGNYERFLNEDLLAENYITTGQIYSEVIRKERAFEYEGTTVEAIPHVTDEIIRRIKLAGEKSRADIVLIELGGTVGEYQNGIFFEAARILKLKNPIDVIHLHVTYLPLIRSVGELKSKPAQTSVHILNSLGIQPDVIIARSEVPVDEKRAGKIAMFCNIEQEDLIFSPDIDSIYKVPMLLAEQKISEKICLKLKINQHINKQTKEHYLAEWKKMLDKRTSIKRKIRIALATKYYKSGDYDLSDSYLSVVEALKHAGVFLETDIELVWVNCEGLELQEDLKSVFANIDGIIVPQGWGSRGTEGKINVVQYARESKIPYFGLCFGMQMAVIEFARNVCGLRGANSTEADPKTKHPVIHIMPDQEEYLKKKQYGGTIRLGQWPSKLSVVGCQLSESYKKYHDFCRTYFDGDVVMERHRHRYEFNNEFKKQLEDKGLLIAATSPDGHLVEAIELVDHPFFVGTQYHPELQSRPLSPHPLFLGFLQACLEKK